MLVAVDDVLTREELFQVRDQLANAPWAAHQSAGPQALLAKHNLQIPEGSEVLKGLRLTVMRALNRSSKLMSAVLPHKIVPPNFNRYSADNNRYGWHTDSSLRYMPDGSCLRTDVSATLFLSEPSEYEGGELVIEDTYGLHTVKLAAGSLVVYPSGSIHEVTPVQSGERLACYLFMQSVVKDTGCRRHLYDMDLALMALRQKHGEEQPEIIRLTGLYNNLLRRWSEC